MFESDSRHVINLKLDNSCTSNSKSEIADWTGPQYGPGVQFKISDFEFEVQELSNFKFLPPSHSTLTQPVPALVLMGIPACEHQWHQRTHWRWPRRRPPLLPR